MTNKTWFSTFWERKRQESKDFNEVIDFFVRSWYEVEDVHEDSDYFDKDIDLLIKKNWIIKSVEIKFDEYLDNTTNNFFFEIISNEEKTTAGCFLKSQANILLYYATHTKNWYFFDLPELKKWFFEVRNDFKYIKDVDKKFKLQSTHTKNREGWYQHTTIWRLVDKNYVLEQCENKWVKHYIFNIEKDFFSLQKRII